ncbi:MAG TPA: pyridoxal-phosphate dependent enzyme [Deltaproteobacteria bacterium]|nr:pyridoxal-phosphate dependent enzyme [Deltaproteobacteria bacterium]
MDPLEIVCGPSPIRPLAVPGLAGRLWIKDEGWVGALYGGNKIRKLRWILADALRSGHRSLVTFGGVGSHHVLATALYGNALGLETHALLFPQPDSPHVRDNAARIAASCASWSPLLDPLRAGAALTSLYARLEPSGRPYRVSVGGSSPVGTLGWVEAGQELAVQVAQGLLPPPARVYAAMGTGGTVLGLQIGLALGGLGAEVVAVRVVPRTLMNRARRASLRRRTLRRLGHQQALGPLRVVHRWSGGGYGVADPEILAVVERARGLGLEVEATYTAKALGAALEELQRDPVDAVFVQTAPSVPLPPVTSGLPAGLGALLL